MRSDISESACAHGCQGIGEIGIAGAGAAVADAVHDTTGRRIRDLPIALGKLP